MWWLEARWAFRTTGRSTRAVVLGWRAVAARACALAVVAAPLLAGCSDGSGFRPLYATTSADGGPGVEQKLAQVDFINIPGRVGQRVRNELAFQGTGGGFVRESGQPSAYRYEVALRESMMSTLVARTGDAAGQIYALDASFRLIRNSDKKVILEGTSFARAGFERYTTIYSNVRAREDAENRAASTIATDLKSRLAAFLSTQS